jgi:hypothetical protein
MAVSFVVMLSVIMLNVTYKIFMLSVVMLSVVILSVVMLNVVAPPLDSAMVINNDVYLVSLKAVFLAFKKIWPGRKAHVLLMVPRHLA